MRQEKYGLWLLKQKFDRFRFCTKKERTVRSFNFRLQLKITIFSENKDKLYFGKILGFFTSFAGTNSWLGKFTESLFCFLNFYHWSKFQKKTTVEIIRKTDNKVWMDGLTNRHEFIGQESLKEYMYMVYFVLTLKLLPLRLKKWKKAPEQRIWQALLGLI